MQVFGPKKCNWNIILWSLFVFVFFFPLKLPHPWPPRHPLRHRKELAVRSGLMCHPRWPRVQKKNIFVGRGCFVYRRAYDLSLLRKDAITKRVSPCEASFKRHIWWWMTYFWCHSNSFVGGFFVKVGMARKQSDVHSPPRPWRAPVPLVRNDVVSPDTMTVSVGYPIKYWQANLACWKMNLLQMLVS